MCACAYACVSEHEWGREIARAYARNTLTMHTGVRAPPSRNLDLSVHRRIIYLLGPCPGGPRHDEIDYANSRNRPSWPKPSRNYASTPSDSASLSPSLSIFFSPLLPLLFLSFFWTALSNFFSLPLLLSPPLFALRALPSSFFKLIHPLSSFLEHQRLLSRRRSFFLYLFSLLLPPFVSSSLSLLRNQNNNNLLWNCFDCSSIWVTTGYPRLCVGIDHLAIHRLRFSGRKGKGR